jgi:hypothetical protein
MPHLHDARRIVTSVTMCDSEPADHAVVASTDLLPDRSKSTISVYQQLAPRHRKSPAQRLLCGSTNMVKIRGDQSSSPPSPTTTTPWDIAHEVARARRRRPESTGRAFAGELCCGAPRAVWPGRDSGLVTYNPAAALTKRARVIDPEPSPP